MITNNWYNMFKYLPLHGIESIPYVATSGTGYTVSASILLDDYANSFTFGLLDKGKTGYNTTGVIFGNGTTAPTVDDYKLGGSLIQNLGITGVDTAEEDANGAVVRTGVLTITNNNTEDVTISEVGYMGQFKSTGTSAYALLDHTLLEEPITIPPEGVGQVTYTITINPPTF